MTEAGTKTEQVISAELYKILEVRLAERSKFVLWLPGLHNTTCYMVANIRINNLPLTLTFRLTVS